MYPTDRMWAFVLCALDEVAPAEVFEAVYLVLVVVVDSFEDVLDAMVGIVTEFVGDAAAPVDFVASAFELAGVDFDSSSAVAFCLVPDSMHNHLFLQPLHALFSFLVCAFEYQPRLLQKHPCSAVHRTGCASC